MRELHCGAEHPSHWRYDAELDLPQTCNRDQVRKQTLVERRRCHDDSIDLVQESGPGAELFC
jgi:hypothetical protein